MDNKAAERTICTIVIRGKNWLFSDTSRGATASAQLYRPVETFNATCPEFYAWHAPCIELLSMASWIEAYEGLLP
ncbi:hypothetical protein AB7M18_005163 [Pseudomonas viridiflava]|nr:hypothetical protein PS634_00612 [Pseudomonas fluorescens]